MLTSSDWVLICTSLFLGATALVAPYLAEVVKRKAFAPKLTVTFAQSPPFCRLSSWRSRVDPGLEEPVYAFHFQVTNEGMSQARRCEAVLEEVWLYDASGTPRRLEDFSPVNLRFDGSGTRFLDLSPRRRVLWNIGHVSSSAHQKREEAKLFVNTPGARRRGLRFLLDLLEYPNRQPNCLGPGKFALRITVYSENAGQATLHLQIAWTGKWQEIETDMFRELVITQVDAVS
jgi:hypothetical protein